MRELGFAGLEVLEWFAFFASPGTPATLIEEWNRHIRAVMQTREIVDALAQIGMEAGSSTPEEARERVARHLAEWRKRMAAVGLQPAN